MQSTTFRRAVAAFVLVSALILPTTLVAQPDRQQIRAQLLPVYQRLLTDPTFQALQQQLAGRMDDAAVVDRLLAYMPMSPLEYLRIDMDVNRYEIAIPRLAFEWHVRWIELHRQEAIDLYGEAYVNELLSGPGEVPAEEGGPAIEPAAATVGTNRNAAATFADPPLEYQGEVQVVVNPNNPNQIVAATNTWDDGMQSVFYSSDGGVTWGHSFPPLGSAYPGLGSCAFTEFGSDPALYWNDVNQIFLEYMALCSFIIGTDYAIVVARSTDGGATWSPQGVVIDSWGTGNVEDKEFYIIDNNLGSPFYGRHYTCWDRNNDERFAYSTDAGITWNEVNLPNVAIDLGCEMAVSDDGTVHLIWDTLNCGATCTNERMFYTRSTNGGLSWSSPVLVRDFNLVGFSGANCPDAQDDRCINPFGSIDVDNTGGACDGTLYVTFSDWTSGGVNETDVWLSRSTDNGNSWSAPLKINDDGLAGRAQFHPFLVVDPSNGHVVVGWHDARNDPGNDAIDYFVARSTDCGVSFEANVQASQASSEFNNSTITYSNENTIDNPNYNPNQYGEYMGVDARDGKAYLAWSDTRHFFPSFTGEPQQENVGFTVVDFGGPFCGNGVKEGTEECDGSDFGGQTCSDFGCTGGTLTCTPICTINTTSCSGCGPCDNDGVCELDEDCNNCPSDCVSGGGVPSCGNLVCEPAAGEDCLSCPSDCNGKQNGNPNRRYCCGDGDGQNPVGCEDSRCSGEGISCGDVQPYCCGDSECDGVEDSCSCALDCGPPFATELFCDNNIDDDCDTLIDCDDIVDCPSTDPACSCLPKNASCTLDSDCCSGVCKNNGRCR